MAFDTERYLSERPIKPDVREQVMDSLDIFFHEAEKFSLLTEPEDGEQQGFFKQCIEPGKQVEVVVTRFLDEPGRHVIELDYTSVHSDLLEFAKVTYLLESETDSVTETYQAKVRDDVRKKLGEFGFRPYPYAVNDRSVELESRERDHALEKVRDVLWEATLAGPTDRRRS